MIEKIISGGQSGIDQLGLKVARELGIPTGGTAPPLFKTEYGPYLELLNYGLVEIDPELQKAAIRAQDFYSTRTAQNVKNSNGTVQFDRTTRSGGYIQTRNHCAAFSRPFILNPTADQLCRFLDRYNIEILNIAGNRDSLCTPMFIYEVEIILKQGITCAGAQLNLNFEL